MMQYRHPAVAKIEADTKAARQAAADDVRKFQATCPHEAVIADGGFHNGRRICAACGLEECADYGWPSTTIDGGLYEFVRSAGLRTILNTEFVKPGNVPSYRLRI